MAQYLRAAVESVLRQSYRDFELIVIDDGSFDNTPELASGFPAEVRYVRQENRGLSAVRNRGIELANGEYIIFLDADDILMEKALESSVLFLDHYPKAGFCCGQVYTIDSNGHPLRIRRARGPRTTFVRDGKEEIKSLLVFDPHDIIHPSTTLIRRSCFEKVGLFDTRLRVGEDVDMWIRLSKKYSVGHLAEPLVKARYHGQSITAKSGVEIVGSTHTMVLESVFDDKEIGPLYRNLREKAYFGLYCLLARVAARTGHKGMGLTYSIKALKTYPKLLFNAKSFSLWISSAKAFLPQQLRRVIIEALMALRLR